MFELTTIPFSRVAQLASKDVAYATGHPALRPFYQYEVNLDTFAQVIADKQRDAIDRALLVSVLEEQYADLPKVPAVQQAIATLGQSNTFTIVTAHQPTLFTGPLYYIYKIFSAINLVQQLRQRYPASQFVPVFVNGAEDHDFEEINHTQLFGKPLVWENEESGAVGLMKTSSLGPVLAQLQELLGEQPVAKDIYRIIEEAYTQNETYGAATNQLVHSLFGTYGLVVLNMNHPKLKRRFLPIMEKEVFEQPSQPLVEKTQQALSAAGFSGQAHARDINLFYLREQLRARIERQGDLFKVVDTDYQFTTTEMAAELAAHPERFSPNVVLRPLFQEAILPNLAYIGGGGEIAYWLERKEQFAHFGLNFPMLIRRNSVLLLDAGIQSRMEKLGLSVEDLFEDTDALIRQFVEGQTSSELSLQAEIKALEDVFEQTRQKAVQVDPTLEKAVLAEGAKQVKVLEQLESRLLRAEKQKHETAINQLRSIKEKLFPGNGLQERTDNFLNFYLKYDHNLFDILLQELDPLKEGFIVIKL